MSTTENNLNKRNKMNKLITDSFHARFSPCIQDNLPTPYPYKPNDTVYFWNVHRGEYSPTVPQDLASRELLLQADGLHWLPMLADSSWNGHLSIPVCMRS